MRRKTIFIRMGPVLVLGAMFLLNCPGLAAEKLKFATPVKVVAAWYLPAVVAEEKGLWKENGLEVEWVAFRGGEPMVHAVAGGHIKMGTITPLFANRAAAMGVPIIMVAQVHRKEPWSVWVLRDSLLKEGRDLGGKRLGVNVFGGIAHIFGLVVLKSLRLEKEVKVVSAGGVSEGIAALKARAIHAFVQGLAAMAELKVRGEVRELIDIGEFLPQEWFDQSVFVHKDLARAEPDAVRRTVKSVRQAVDFIRQNPDWCIDKLKSGLGMSDSTARIVYNSLDFTREGRIDKNALVNIRNFLMEWNIIPQEKIKPIEEVYTNDFLS